MPRRSPIAALREDHGWPPPDREVFLRTVQEFRHIIEPEATAFAAMRRTDEQFKDEAGFWYADLDTIYVRFVSNDATYGGDLANWPQSFINMVEGYLALKISPRLIKAANQRLFRWAA